MSNINQTATVTLQANGQQVTSTLNQLKQRALELENAFAKAAAAGNKTQMKTIQRELKATRSQIKQMTSSAEQAEAVLHRLDKATPRELNQTLRVLNKELQNLERGSAAWNAQTEKIRRVKGELSKLNEEVRIAEGRWQKFNRVINDWQTTIMGAAAAVTGLVMAGRSAVNAFAEMDAELANVRKFTGMSSDEVEKLNEEFHKIDTRTSRVELNKLAEEAGRLGKQSVEDVLGFVKAADVINVALDDLGDGATLTLSKLTTIFGVEKQLGTEKSLLAVGSVINELSQNCTASAPYLANFAKRMAGVGAQAQMTIPEIMGFAAVLDAQGQACEMSATALSKLIMDVFKDTPKIIKATGIEAEAFNEALKRSTNEGLIMLIEHLQKLGNIDVLAPVFKDMGENGARASSVISALAANIDMVKWEQEEAAKAFEEGTSVTKEFNVQNNTVQAGLDKARKRVAELAIELGEKLMPVMRHVMSSTTMILKLMNNTIDFVKKYGTEILVLTASFVAYKVAVNASNIAFKLHYALVVATQAVTHAYAAVVKGLTAAKIALQIIMAKLNGNWARQSWLMLDAKKAGVSLASGYGILAAAAVALTYVFVKLFQRLTDVSQAQKDMQAIRKKGQEAIVEEKRQIESLIAVARDEKASLDDRQAAINALNKIIPKYNAQLDATTGKYIENKQALDAYLRSLARKYEIEGAKELLVKIGQERAQLAVDEENFKQEEKRIADERKKRATNPRNYATSGGAFAPTVVNQSMGESATIISTRNELNRRKKVLDEREATIMGAYGEDIRKSDLKTVTAPKEQPVTTTTPKGGSGGGSSHGGSNDSHTNSTSRGNIFEKEDAWKKEQEAYNRIDYATGKKNHQQYTDRLLEIEVEYNKKRRENKQATQAELLQVDAAYYEALKKQQDAATARSIEEENKRTSEQVLELTQFYVDGKLSKEAFDDAMEKEELDHAKAMVALQKEGSKERLEAEQHYADLQAKAQDKRLKETEEKEKKAQEERKKMKEKYFGNNPAENKALFAADLAVLETVYAAELKAAEDNAEEKLRIEKAYHEARLALMKQYNIEGAEENLNFMQGLSKDITEFLESDTGKSILGATEVLLDSMSSIFSQLSDMVNSELQIQTAKLEKRYDSEISLAEGNKYKTVRLEKQKEKEIAKLKSEANKKLFAMQVIQAVASTALSAINAYSSAAQVPMIGYILAPIAAATAVAAGMLQVAAIKKQQQASESQGYAEGGFTKPGKKYEPAGVVHAGEWVASQKLLASPVARPVINALDYAQKTNTIGSLRAEDASRVAGGVVVQQIATPTPQIVVPESVASTEPSPTNSRLESVIERLEERLQEPFVTVNTVSGDAGIKQAQDEYLRLMRNKTPKSRRN